MNCAALAIDATLNVKVTPRMDGRVGIRYFGEDGNRIPRDRSNLVVRAMETALHLRGLEFIGADFEVYSSVPVGVGLGSSTAAVLAGLIAADCLYSLRLNEKTLFDLARIYEPRSDNLHAAWHGGFVACTGMNLSPVIRRTFVPGDFMLSVVTPDSKPPPSAAEVPTPGDSGSHGQTHNFERAEALAELFTRSGKSSAPGLESAVPPISRQVVPGLKEVLNLRAESLMGIFVCGSGPAVGLLTRGNPGESIRAVRQRFLEFGVGSTFGVFRPTNAGASELNAVMPQSSFPSVRMTEALGRAPVS